MMPRPGGTALVLAVVAAAAAPAQLSPQDAALDSVEALLDEGRYPEARTALATLLDGPSDLTPAARARSLLLRASLQGDPRAAESDYLAVVLGHPTTPDAAEALLRLGQALLATGDPSRAAGYLQRLVADYPGYPLRGVALLWLARAHLANGDRNQACQAARAGLAMAGGDGDLSALLELEQAGSCRMRGEAAPTGAGAGTGTIPERGEGTDTGTGTAGAGEVAGRGTEGADGGTEGAGGGTATGRTDTAGSYAVQVGAFRSRVRADGLVKRLDEAGYEARAVLVPGSTLIRVRVGRFGSQGEAAGVLGRIRRAGYDAVLVTDAARERSP